MGERGRGGWAADWWLGGLSRRRRQTELCSALPTERIPPPPRARSSSLIPALADGAQASLSPTRRGAITESQPMHKSARTSLSYNSIYACSDQMNSDLVAESRRSKTRGRSKLQAQGGEGSLAIETHAKVQPSIEPSDRFLFASLPTPLPDTLTGADINTPSATGTSQLHSPQAASWSIRGSDQPKSTDGSLRSRSLRGWPTDPTMTFGDRCTRFDARRQAVQSYTPRSCCLASIVWRVLKSYAETRAGERARQRRANGPAG